MKTHTSSQSRIITVWLVLLAFLCCMMVPSIALAKKDMVIATEGDPTDGLDNTGGGGSGSLDPGDGGEPQISPNILDFGINFELVPTCHFYFLPVWENGHLIIVLVLENPTVFPRGAIK